MTTLLSMPYRLFTAQHAYATLGLTLVAFRRCDTLCTSGFVYDVMFAHNRQGKGERHESTRVTVEMSHQQQHGFDAVAYTQTDSTGGCTEPGMEFDVVALFLNNSIIINESIFLTTH